MSFLKAIEAGAMFCALCGIGCWALSKWSKTADPEDEEREFDERVVYGDFKEFIWRKKQQQSK